MKYQLICTSYNKLEDESLQLRNNWIEPCLDNETLSDLFKRYNIDLNSFTYPAKNSISNIIIGKMSIDCPIHIRIVRF